VATRTDVLLLELNEAEARLVAAALEELSRIANLIITQMQPSPTRRDAQTDLARVDALLLRINKLRG
jgi:hypothetical protein